jgi:hypothetical protein
MPSIKPSGARSNSGVRVARLHAAIFWRQFTPTPKPVGKLVKVRGMRRPIETFEIAFALIGAAAISLASFVYWGVYHQSGASFILVGTAGLLGVLMNSLRKPNPDRPIVVHPAKCRLGAKS